MDDGRKLEIDGAVYMTIVCGDVEGIVGVDLGPSDLIEVFLS